MLEITILLAQCASVALMGAWLTVGVWDNLRHPEMNETFTALVLEMERMKEEYPDHYALVAHRAISSRTMQKNLFRLVVFAETCAALTLITGTIALAMASMGEIDPELARSIGLLGTILFTLVWGGFLVVGNYFCYWYCHDEAQNTHYQMTLWGTANLIFLAVV